MESGWIVNYKDGERIMFTEKRFKDYDRTEDKSLVVSEEHWFDIEVMKKKNPNLFIYE